MERSNRARALAAAMLGTLMLVGATGAGASESGGNQYPLGSENTMAGAVPPPGSYLLDYAIYYHAGRLNDQNGNKQPFDFDLDVYANALRYLHVTNLEILGGNWGFHLIVPVARIDVSIGGNRWNRTGLGDIVIDPVILSWHTKNWHWVTGIDLYLPTGSYSKTDPASFGRNYFGIEPIFGVTYLSDDGWEGSGKFMYAFNTENGDTRYTTGQEFHVDFFAGKHIDSWTLGAGGYFYQQTTEDSWNGNSLAQSQGRVFALGPTVKYDYKSVSLIGSWSHEMAVENRPVGERAMLKLVVGF